MKYIIAILGFIGRFLTLFRPKKKTVQDILIKDTLEKLEKPDADYKKAQEGIKNAVANNNNDQLNHWHGMRSATSRTRLKLFSDFGLAILRLKGYRSPDDRRS